MKKLLFFCIIFSVFVVAQDNSLLYKSFEQINSNQLNEAEQNVKLLEDNTLQQLMRYKIEYLKNGKVETTIFEKIIPEKDNKTQQIVYNLFFGDYLSVFSQKLKAKSFNYFNQSLQFAKQQKDTVLMNEVYKRMLYYLQQNPKNIKQYYLIKEEFLHSAKGNHYKFWANYYDLSYKILENYEKKAQHIITENSFAKVRSFAQNNNYLLAITNQIQAIFYDVLMKDLPKAKILYQKAEQQFSTVPFYFSQINVFYNQYNQATVLYENKQYKKSIAELQKLLNNKHYKYELFGYKYIFDWLGKNYEKLGVKDSALYCKNKSYEYDKKINEIESAVSIHLINTQYQLNEKNREISTLKKLQMNYQQYKILYGIIIFFIFLLALYSFVRWKRIDYFNKNLAVEKANLEVEHYQTIQQLEKVKQLVIEDHIILKNKAKVYLQDLIYIKAEDHYLQLITTTNKEFVRGKISEILTELPPNFAQTHRSYIVNKNFVHSIQSQFLILHNKTEIPLSRNFKRNFSFL